MSRPLASTDVLLVDCQTTGANPARGQIVEIAWCRTSARAIASGTAPVVHAHLVALEDGRRLPRRIAALTGIDERELEGASPARDAAAHLGRALADRPPLVAHVARFERAFVDDLRARHGLAEPPPLDWVCTHEIVCRLLPGLPHRGLNAVAGHLGHVVAEGKRAPAHVLATCAVWAGVVELLERDAGVTTFDGLGAWTAATAPARRVGHDFSVARDRRLSLPDAPGVYRMLGHAGQVLYVGKATSLRTRVNSYFQKRRHAAARTKEMLAQVADVAVEESGTALEAALLECDAIKRLAPPYNVALRGRGDDPVFVGADLCGARSGADPSHRLGPLPGGELPAMWCALAELLGGGPEPAASDAFRRAFGLPAEAALDMDVAREGLATFVAERLPGGGGAPLHRRLRGLGAREWRAWREALAAAADAPDDEQPQGPEESPDAEEEEDDATDAPREPWTPDSPEAVVRLLTAVTRQGAHLVRRGHWLRQLTECSLVWRPPGRGAGDAWRLLGIDAGRTGARHDVAPGTSAPVPAGHARSAEERGAVFDVATYERLRVLTTEIRRLVAAGVSLELCLGPRQRLGRDALARRLFWV